MSSFLVPDHADVLQDCSGNDVPPECEFDDMKQTMTWYTHQGPTDTPNTGPDGDTPSGKGSVPVLKMQG